MADNLVANPGAAGATFRTDDLGGAPAVHVPYTKILLGGDGVDAGGAPGDAANGIDVDVTRSALPTGASTSALQTQPGVDIGDVTVNNGAAGAAVNIQDGGNSITIDGAVAISSGSVTVFGNEAVDAPISGEGVGIISRASTATPAAVSADGDVQYIWIDRNGRVQVTVNSALPVGGNNIGDVDVLTVPAPLSTTGGGTEATALRVTIANDSTGLVSIDDNGGSLTVDGTVAVSGTVTVDTEITAPSAQGDNQSNAVNLGFLANFPYYFDGTTWDRVRGDSVDGALVNLGANNDVTVASLPLPAGAATLAEQQTQTASLSVMDDWDDGADRARVVGAIAHDSAVGGNPVLVGAEARSTEGTAVTAGDVSRLQADLVGKLIVRPHAIPELTVSGVASTTATTDTSVIAAQGASVRIYVTSISVANSSAVDCIIEIKDATTVIWRTAAPQKGGSNIVFDPPLRLTANQALNMASLSAATTVYFSANGYKGA